MSSLRLIQRNSKRLNAVKLTREVVTWSVALIALYDLVIVTYTGGTEASVSSWVESFSGYFVPVYAMMFLAGHFFSAKTDENAKPTNMTPWKFRITAGVIAAFIYDLIVIQTISPRVSISHLISLLITVPTWITIVLGLISGKYLGTLYPIKPAEPLNE